VVIWGFGDVGIWLFGQQINFQICGEKSVFPLYF
jgi:hypothetical protein